VYCDIARNLDEERLRRIRTLEEELGLTIVAFLCRSLDPAREERLRAMMEELGPVLQAAPAEPDEAQLLRIREAEETLGLSLVAVTC
jgi:hypothetical protein